MIGSILILLLLRYTGILFIVYSSMNYDRINHLTIIGSVMLVSSDIIFFLNDNV